MSKLNEQSHHRRLHGKLRVLHVIPGLPVGGAERTLFRLVDSLEREGIESSVVSLTTLGEIGLALQRRGVKVCALQISGLFGLARGFARLRRVIRRTRPDVLQTWLYAGDLSGTLASLGLHPVVVWNVRSSDMTQGTDRTTAVIPWLSKLSRLPNVIVTNSKAGRIYHESRGYRPKSWRLIPNGVDTELFSPSASGRSKTRTELGIHDDQFVFGIVGRYDRVKNHDGALRLASALCKDRRDVHFIFVGRGLDSANSVISNVIRDLGIPDRCHLLGERSDIADIYPAFDVFLSTSLSEGLPNCIAEAMATAVPCAATDVGDTRDLIGNTGLVFRPNDLDAAAAACIDLISRTQVEREQLGNAARQRITSMYAIEAETSAYATLYRELAELRKR